MFLNKREPTGAVLKVIRTPKPLPIQHGQESLTEYEALAAELEFAPAQLLGEQLLRFMAEHDMPIYDFVEVSTYLDKMADKQGKRVLWKPLRQQDREIGQVIWRNSHKALSRDFATYDKAVPIHILRRVKTINERFKNKAAFYVSDYEVPNPDPFILIAVPGMPPIVFGVWDEPAFFEKSTNIAE